MLLNIRFSHFIIEFIEQVLGCILQIHLDVNAESLSSMTKKVSLLIRRYDNDDDNNNNDNTNSNNSNDWPQSGERQGHTIVVQ